MYSVSVILRGQLSNGSNEDEISPPSLERLEKAKPNFTELGTSWRLYQRPFTGEVTFCPKGKPKGW